MRPGDHAILTCLPGGVWSREPPVCLPGLGLAMLLISFVRAVTLMPFLPCSLNWATGDAAFKRSLWEVWPNLD